MASCSSPYAAPPTRPKAPQNTPNTEKPAGSRSRAARYSTAYPHSAEMAVATPTRATLPRVMAAHDLVGPRRAQCVEGRTRVGHSGGTAVENSQAFHSGCSDTSA